MYEAAKLLYKRFQPMLEEHLASTPFAKVAFVGHSLGGSLGTLLMLMFLHRGVLPHSAVSPTYTFGAPAIFCEACGPGGTCAPRSATSILDPGQAGSAAARSATASAVRPNLPLHLILLWFLYSAVNVRLAPQNACQPFYKQQSCNVRVTVMQ